LKTDAKLGISSTEHRENDFGSNKVFVEPVPPFCSYVLEALEDLMIRILVVAAIVQTILGCTLADDPSKDWIDGLSIMKLAAPLHFQPMWKPFTKNPILCWIGRK
jgi:hypothetical protein